MAKANQIISRAEKFTKKYIAETIEDFTTCCLSREASLLARREVLTGKAKFGITGDGKEVPQVALARSFKNGDWRSGYYRDQTIMMALGLSTLENFFAQLYADSDNDPFSKGRQMNNHFATGMLDSNGEWLDQTTQKNTSSGISSTAGQMARGLGLAMASKMYKSNSAFVSENFSENGDEVCFVTIGDASTSEGVFWETINAANVMQVPMIVSVWDDGYGISVPKKYQTAKEDISTVLSGFKATDDAAGMVMFKEDAWNYAELRDIYDETTHISRRDHSPCFVHVTGVTQPQGHSTSGSHERYKSKERLQWEKDHDCILLMEQWINEAGIASKDETQKIKKEAKVAVREAKNKALSAFRRPVVEQRKELIAIFEEMIRLGSNANVLNQFIKELNGIRDPYFFELVALARKSRYALIPSQDGNISLVQNWLDNMEQLAHRRYNSDLYSTTPNAAINVSRVDAIFDAGTKMVSGFEVLNSFFDKMLETVPNLVAFGEDVGLIGDVNQGFAGLQSKYGSHRVFDTGIREWTIMGQAIGLAMRGFRPIAEIQYLDYLVYGLTPLTDDLATLRYRSGGLQKAPAIIRTRGHRLEGIWHSGSPMGMIINSLRGMYVCVPRDMVRAVGMYNTLLKGDDPAIVIESLNGYRLKEKMPSNIEEFTIPLGVPERLREGNDITIVSYGSTLRIVQDAIEQLSVIGIEVDLIDVMTLLPFDTERMIVESLKKTSRIIFVDEDVPGGATAFMLRNVIEIQEGYKYLDSKPICVTSKEHRPPYGSDGDYFGKPNAEDVFAAAYDLMHEFDPDRFPMFKV